MGTQISRYGLAKNPYYVDRILSFDPNSEAVEPFPVDGFRDLGAEGSLPQFLTQRIRVKKPAYVLVRGPNGIGRTAAARHILKRYAEFRNARLLIAPEIKPNNDPVDVLQRWLGSLSSELLRETGSLDDEIARAFDRVLEAKEFNQTFKTGFQNLLIQVDRRYGGVEKSIVFGFCLEDPPEKFPTVEVLRALFWQVSTVVILVIHANTDLEVDEQAQEHEQGSSDPIVDLFVTLSSTGAGWIFPRSKLATADIQLLAEKYWESVRPKVRCPIEPESIEGLGDRTPLPLVGILSVLAEALEERARSAGDGCWPDDLSLLVDKERLRIIHETFIAASKFRSRWNRTR